MTTKETTAKKSAWPKHQVRDAFQAKGKTAARELGKKLQVANHRVERWLREWDTGSKKTTAKKNVVKMPAKKATTKKVSNKKGGDNNVVPLRA